MAIYPIYCVKVRADGIVQHWLTKAANRVMAELKAFVEFRKRGAKDLKILGASVSGIPPNWGQEFI
jgi:hypothetical protein